MWRNISPEEKKAYQQAYQEEMVEFRKKWDAYTKTENYLKWVKAQEVSDTEEADSEAYDPREDEDEALHPGDEEFQPDEDFPDEDSEPEGDLTSEEEGMDWDELEKFTRRQVYLERKRKRERERMALQEGEASDEEYSRQKRPRYTYEYQQEPTHPQLHQIQHAPPPQMQPHAQQFVPLQGPPLNYLSRMQMHMQQPFSQLMQQQMQMNIPHPQVGHGGHRL